ncbi:acetyltransferase [Ochrobactrum phage POI1126]|uniref:Acetyltransferase n=1 Tax=Ochrobactrum phage POI1126 TaxID=1932118 RepID=A0A240F4V5_9CAUD|nr:MULTISPECIES: hypothetical protein [Brucella]YP_010665196.1 acetyltransferase [Ochrobactrum phage POI1126]APU92983.1 acetyltransferase [Ochrobactrum phage POI1126]RUQ67064.1 hypothetical protein ELZ23_15960 [Brucella abortus]RUQ77933.1 hypothetical protein ELZ22_17580 [Brucella abortus]RUQ88167.1 hypothetical protein ELZ18_16035 [Brucella abortus]RUQ89288.1 hypothetical protein ELZ20_17180 [Brucella abortus]
MTDETENTGADDGFEWAVVEVFGHRRHAGRAREEERFGAKMLRIDIPSLAWPEDQPEAKEPVITGWVTHFYGGASIFSYTLTTEQTAMQMNRPYKPASIYALPEPDLAGDDEYPA